MRMVSHFYHNASGPGRPGLPGRMGVSTNHIKELTR